MVSWINAARSLPEEGTYLVLTKCRSNRYSPPPKKSPHPFKTINVAYLDVHKNWHYNSYEHWDKKIRVTHWAPIPNFVKEL